MIHLSIHLLFRFIRFGPWDYLLLLPKFTMPSLCLTKCFCWHCLSLNFDCFPWKNVEWILREKKRKRRVWWKRVKCYQEKKTHTKKTFHALFSACEKINCGKWACGGGKCEKQSVMPHLQDNLRLAEKHDFISEEQRNFLKFSFVCLNVGLELKAAQVFPLQTDCAKKSRKPWRHLLTYRFYNRKETIRNNTQFCFWYRR